MTDPTTIARAQVAIENGLIEALQSQTQADMDGTTVIVSRQACDEAAEFLPALYDEVKRLRADLRHVIDERDATFALMLARAEKAEAALAENEAAAEGALMILLQTQAERDAQIARMREELHEMTRSRDEWRNDFRALEKAIVGDTGLSAMTVAVQARLFRPRAEKAEAERDALRAHPYLPAEEIAAIERGNRRWHGEYDTTVSVRWEPYKPDGQRQMKAKGRWQTMTYNGSDYFRWENCNRPAQVRQALKG